MTCSIPVFVLSNTNRSRTTKMEKYASQIFKSRNLFIVILILVVELSNFSESKVVEFGDKLPKFIKEQANNGWLINFYTQACPKCHQIEPTYLNVAEKIYHGHDNLIVGRIDCSKFKIVCAQYSINEYPTIVFLKGKEKYIYNDDSNTAQTIIEFAERLHAPTIEWISECKHIFKIAKSKGVVVLGTFDFDDDNDNGYHEKRKSNHEKQQSNKLFSAYSYAIHKHKLRIDYWFYATHKACFKDFIRRKLTSVGNDTTNGSADDGTKTKEKTNHSHGNNDLLIMKGDTHEPSSTLNSWISEKGYEKNTDITKLIVRWVRYEAFPVFKSYSRYNLKTALASGKHFLIAVLEDYKPAKQMLKNSLALKDVVEKMAVKHALSGQNSSLVYGYTTDIDFVNEIAIRFVKPLPNIMLLKPDMSFTLMRTDEENGNKQKQVTSPSSSWSKSAGSSMSSSPYELKESQQMQQVASILPKDLSEMSILQFIELAMGEQLPLEGGSAYWLQVLRKLFSLYSTIIQMTTGNKELVILLTIMCTAVSVALMFATHNPPVLISATFTIQREQSRQQQNNTGQTLNPDSDNNNDNNGNSTTNNNDNDSNISANNQKREKVD